MVQASRLDLIRPLAAAGLVLLFAGGVRAQPLLSNPSLTTLLQPQRLDRSRPLLPPDQLAGTREVGPGGTPCVQGGASKARSGTDKRPVDRPLYGGTDRPLWSMGPAAAGKTTSAGASAGVGDPATARPGADRPRDRPLWAEGPQASAAPADDDPAPGLNLMPCSLADPPLSR